MNQVVSHLYRCALRQECVDCSDAELLECFVHRHHEVAFEALVHRLGPMVWGVCQRALPHADAEDAFQAVFLVLLRKADSIVPREKVGAWLFGVTHNIVRKAKSVLQRRWAREKPMPEVPEKLSSSTESSNEVLAMLDVELLHLPDSYRLPILLCDLQGKSRKEVAQHLDLPEGTLSARLTRGRRLLANRLAKRGEPLAIGLVAGLTNQLAHANAPLAVLDKTVQAVPLASSVSPQVIALTEGVLRMMWFAKIQHVCAYAVLLGALGLGLGVVALTGSRAHFVQGPNPNEPMSKPEPNPGPKMWKLEGSVQQVVWSANGKVFAGIATRRVPRKEKGERRFDTFTTVRIHNGQTGEEMHSLGELKNPHYAGYKLSSDGSLLAISQRFTIETGDRVQIWDTKLGRLVRELKMEYARSRPLLDFAPDAKTFALSFGGLSTQPLMRGARLFDVQTGKELATFAKPGSTGTTLAFSPDGKTLATGNYADHTLELWDIAAGKALRRYASVEGSARVLAFSPDGKTLGCGSSNNGIQLWDVNTGKVKPSLEDNPGDCSALVFSYDGRWLAGAHRTLEDGQPTKHREVRVWDAKTRKLMLTLPRTSTSLSFAPNGRTLYVLIPDQGIRHVDLTALSRE